MSGPFVSIILAPHNGLEHLPACLGSVFAQDYRNIEVIMVDNASTDGSSDYVGRHFPAVKRIKSAANLAYGAGNNLGASIAKGDFLLFLNHDTVVTKSFLLELVRTLQKQPDVGVAQSKIMMASRPELIDSAGAYLTRTGMWFHPGRGESDGAVDPEPVEILGAAGACLMVRRTVFDDLRGFDSDFVIYFDDADLSWRARLFGNRVVMVPRSVIYHWGAATTRRLPSTFTIYHSFKNRLCSLIKLLSFRDLALILPVHLTLCAGAALAYFLRLKPANGLAVLKALSWNLGHLQDTLAKRNEFAQMIGSDGGHGLEDLIKPLPLGWFVRASSAYLSKW